MDQRTFGRTGLSVSIAGVGAGGASRLGISTGSSEEQAIALIHRAVDLGINYFDTAANYHNEEVLGRALEGHRDEVVISSKISPRDEAGSLLDRAGLRRGLELALTKLRSDVVDVFHVHRPMIEDYDHCEEVLLPELEALREEGKLRFIGVSGTTGADPTHATLRRALGDDRWDVMMVGFNLFNQGAREAVFAASAKQQVAIEIMGAAKAPLSRPSSS
jgi:aryl-alcohol dehydrogenase-like predicted oxidoreductase